MFKEFSMVRKWPGEGTTGEGAAAKSRDMDKEKYSSEEAKGNCRRENYRTSWKNGIHTSRRVS